MEATFADNPSYAEYEDLLTQLARLMADGKGDSDEAEALREAMDKPARELTLDEIERLTGLSADLSMLQDEEVFDPLQPGEELSAREPERLRGRLAEASARNDADTMLVLLRKGTAGLSRSQRAHYRARAYEALGHPKTALLFMRHAAERDPGSIIYKVGVLTLLDRLEQRDELYQKASEYLAHEESSPELCVFAAGLLFESTRDQPQEQAAPVLALVIRSLESVLPLLETAPHQILPDLAGRGQLLLGFCYEGLGRNEDAISAYNKATVSPALHGIALVVRGRLLLRESRLREALADFEEAIESNIPLVEPYVYLAHHALLQGDYDRCIQLCDLALGKTPKPGLQAVLLHWKAIAGAELGAPTVLVRRAFEMALALDPLNAEIRHNFEILRQQEHSRSAPLRGQWRTPGPPKLDSPYQLNPVIPVAA